MSGKETGKRKAESSSEEEEKAKPDAKKACTESPVSFQEKIAMGRSAICKSVAEFKFNKKRVRLLSKTLDCPDETNGIVYWMSRDQRVQDNWAFLYAQKLALKMEVPLHVCFCLVPKFLDATIRHYTFLLEGLKEVEKECRELDISFHLLTGHAKEVLPSFIEEHKIGALVTDFSPLRVPAGWVKDVSKAIPKDVAFCQVDAHNLVPCWEASPKLEYGARTIRSKIQKQLPGYLTEFPPLCQHPYTMEKPVTEVDWTTAYKSLEVDQSVPPVDWAIPGMTGALKTLETFCKERLKYFNKERNNPNRNALSNLSPWIHFGQISVQRCIIVVKQYRSKSSESVEAFIEEAVVRRELADNFCFYNEHYDKIDGAYSWAKESLKLHEKDKRTHIYSREKLEKGQTHDKLWNAAQNQMVNEGKMHGFMRMYWAKKILEWTPSPKEALEIAIYLNDKYSLDGRDPNGYVGCMWSICGIHDQGWKEREVFGKIRYMNYKGCERKFNVPQFESKYKRQTITK